MHFFLKLGYLCMFFKGSNMRVQMVFCPIKDNYPSIFKPPYLFKSNKHINLFTPFSAGVEFSDSGLDLLAGLLTEVPMMKSESSFCFNMAILLSILSRRHFN